MLKKRLIGVITVRNNMAVQSFSYQRYLPLGKPEYLVENLDRWGVDEILIQVTDRQNHGPDLALIRRLSALKAATPICYGGGIRNEHDAAAVIHAGVERVSVDALLHDNPEQVRSIAQLIGAQAVILSLPISMSSGRPQWFDYRDKRLKSLGSDILSLMTDRMASEILLTDADNEGGKDSFTDQVLNFAQELPLPLIVFGGVTSPEQQRGLLEQENIAAVAVGNALSYAEHAVQKMKQLCDSVQLRAAGYQMGSGGWV
ncbi:HisA/HisF-related TIM barrel protein [Thalassolituus sp. LLYu03]|uniref:HisA/HisF-related TIM barrel protein n=1 Tax=Thalassolituus sp. LLYu03 TaxID=3421656 RepID=UPI003D2A5190